MTFVYIIAVEGGHVRIGAGPDMDAEINGLRARYRMRFDLAYRAEVSGDAREVVRRARKALNDKLVCETWFDARPAEAAAAIVEAAAAMSLQLRGPEPLSLFG